MSEYDVIVIGSGLAGLAAACEASDAGASVLVLEKMNYYGGNSAISGGGFASWDSKLKLREELGLGEDSWELHMSDTINAGKNESIPELVETLVKGGPEAIDWMVEQGVPYKSFLVQLGGYSAPRSHHTACSGKQMIDIVKAATENRGVEVRLNCKVTALQQCPSSGRICGLSYESNGETVQLAAKKAVIIASGGFGYDVELREKAGTGLGSAYNCSNHRGATGEVLLMATELGADTVHMQYAQLFPCANPVAGSVDPWAFHSYSSAGFGAIYVDGSGRRFVNEMLGRDEVSAAHIEKCDKPAWAVFNGAIAEQLGIDEKTIKNGRRQNRMYGSESLEELASLIGADPAVLCDTVAKHNAAIAAGEGDEMGRPIGISMLAMNDGPYYAINQWPSVHYTMGGLRIDTGAHVLNTDGLVIPGLFAAGEVCGGVHGANRLGGNALTECVVFGRIAGKNAVTE